MGKSLKKKARTIEIEIECEAWMDKNKILPIIPYILHGAMAYIGYLDTRT